MQSPKILMLGAKKQVGKDTFCQLLKELKPSIERVAFADQLREYVYPITRQFFGKHPNDLTLSEKELARPIMIEVGRLARTLNIDYWVKIVADQIKYEWAIQEKNGLDKTIFVCCDCRYLNEYQYFKREFGDEVMLVNIERIGAPEPTDEEKIHAPELKKLADVNFTWSTDESFVTLRPQISYFYSKYFLGHE